MGETGVFAFTEIRSQKGDDGLLSPSPYDTLSIALNHPGVASLLPEVFERTKEIELALAPLGARPHWGKVQTASFWAPRLPEIWGAYASFQGGGPASRPR